MFMRLYRIVKACRSVSHSLSFSVYRFAIPLILFKHSIRINDFLRFITIHKCSRLNPPHLIPAMRLLQTILLINLILLDLSSSEKVTVYPSSTSDPASDWITWPQSTNKIALTIQCSSYNPKVAFQMLEGGSMQGMFVIRSTYKDLLIHCREGGARDWNDGNLLTFPTTSWGICSSGTSETLTIERTSVIMKIMKGDVVVFRRKWAADDGKCLLDAGFWRLQNYGTTVVSAESVLGISREVIPDIYSGI